MKDWILGLCPEIEPWQADLIEEHVQQREAALEREVAALRVDAER